MKIALVQKRLYALAAITAAPALFLLVASICSSAPTDLNACRLAQIVGIVHHDPLYPDPTHGVMSAWTFGPVPALLFLISSTLTRPTSQLLAAVCINAAIVLGSALWLNLRLAGKENRVIGWLAFLVFLWCVLTHDSLGQIAFAVSPDGPMVGFATCAVALLLRPRGRLQPALAAVAMVLALWCKASAFALLVVAPIYLLVRGDRRTAVRYTSIFAIAAAIVSGIFIVSFGLGNMWHFMVTLPMSQPWLNGQMDVISDRGLASLADVVVALVHDLLPTLALLAAALLLGRYLSNHERSSDDCAWLMLPAMALLLIPAAVLGYLKMGRHAEAFGAVHLFVLLTATTILIRVFRNGAQVSAKSIVVACVCVFSLWQATAVVFTWHRLANLYQMVQNTYSNPQETAYAFARDHPGEVFFPLNTLSTLQADGKLYHCEWGFDLYYRAHPNERVDVERIREFTPDHMRFIAFPQPHESERIRLVFPQANQPASIAQLPGFIAYTQTAPR